MASGAARAFVRDRPIRRGESASAGACPDSTDILIVITVQEARPWPRARELLDRNSPTGA